MPALRLLRVCLMTLGACAAFACSDDEAPSLSEPADAGFLLADAGPTDLGGDVGVLEDAGAADLGAEDLGAADTGVDAGTPDTGAPDAGPADSGTDGGVDLRAWFANYNAGQTTAYLEPAVAVSRSGDARYPNAAAHVHYRDAAYGPFPRNLLDAWVPTGTTAAPLVVFIHGGGFQTNSKEAIHNNARTLPGYLSSGIAVASISYRFAYRDPEAAIASGVPNGEGSVHDVNGARLDYILRDCARAVQYLRYRAADWNLDPTRIAVYGGSAGAGCSMWIAGVPDLAEPSHTDPVLRESTRVSAVGHQNGQPTYAWTRWATLLGLDAAFVQGHVQREAERLTQTRWADLGGTPEGRALEEVLDYYQHYGAGDPPLFTINQGQYVDETTTTASTQIIHHPRAHEVIYDRCVAEGVGDCSLFTRMRTEGPDRRLPSFMERILLGP